VEVFSGVDGSVLASFLAYDPSFSGGVRVAVQNIAGNGALDIVTAAGPGGGPVVHAYQGLGLTLLDDYYAYDPRFMDGVFVGGC
jgi:hypothetical protein